MRKCCFLLLVMSLFISTRANDGVFYAQGSTLIPLKETVIKMQKEILNLEKRGDWMQVDIYFEFNNPGPARQLTVGFVTPPAFGDVEGGDEAEGGHPQIKDFMVMAGNKILPFKSGRLKESGFKLNEKLANGYDFVYYFTVDFPAGISVVRHSYMYRGGASVEAKHEFYYRLTTGATWAGNAISDFELNINMGDDSYFAVPASFGAAPVNWTVVGVGRISQPIRFTMYEDEGSARNLRMVYLRRGKLQLRQAAFSPKKDLGIEVYLLHNELRLWGDTAAAGKFELLRELLWIEPDSLNAVLGRVSDFQLRVYRNLNFARKGYDFKDEALRKLFEKFNWYLPDPALKTEGTPEYYVSKELLRLIADEENWRKQKAGTL